MSSCYEDVLNDDGVFESMDDDDDLHIHYSYLLFVQVYTMLAYYFHWFVEVNLGRKGKEKKRHRQSFEVKIGSKLSDYFFRRIYRMKRASFDKLHSVLQPRLEAIFFPKGGGTRKKNKRRYLIDTKTRLSMALKIQRISLTCTMGKTR